MCRAFPILAATLSFLLSSVLGCERPDQNGGAQWDTLANGAARVRYATLVDDDVPLLVPNLRLGALEGDSMLVFGDVRSVDAGADGTIYVLDTQASQIRAFDGNGRFLRIVASRGRGPGEVSEANGMILLGDSVLWIQDHASWTMIGVTTDGTEVGRFPMHVKSYGYAWNGSMDLEGRFWKPRNHSDQAPVFPPPEGLRESTFRRYQRWYDPASERTDSVFVGMGSRRTYIRHFGRGGFGFIPVPFDPMPVTLVDPAGGFWQADGSEYRIARLNQQGDTVLVIEAGIERLPVTDHDRSSYVDRMLERDPDQRRILEEVASLMRDHKPAIADVLRDDEHRLWVGRTMGDGELPLYDLFQVDGTFIGSLRLGFTPSEGLPLRIRHGNLYAIVKDELEVPFVVRARVTG